MDPLAVNPATGFLESDNRRAFTSEDKLKCIKLAQEFVDKEEAPDLRWICGKVGISTVTFWRHYDQDSQFKEMYDEIRFQIEDILQRSLVRNGQRANGVGASAFWLKNKVPERWSDNPVPPQLNIDMSSIKNALLSIKSKAIDAVIVDNGSIISTPICDSQVVDK